MKNNLTTVKKVAFIAALSALGFILNFIEIPYPLLPYLKFDPSEVVVLLGTAISLPVGIAIALLKGLLFVLIRGADPVGGVALIIGSLTIAISFYLFRLKFNEPIALIATTVLFAAVMTLFNIFIFIPLYGAPASILIYAETFLFNIIKGAGVSILYYAINKILARYL